MSEFNYNWEVYSFFFKKVSELVVLRNAGIKVYSTVPSNAKLPYLKIESINASSHSSFNEDSRDFSFSLKILTEDKSTKNLMYILDEIYKNIAMEITGTSYSNDDGDVLFKILKINSTNFGISEDITNDLWIGSYNISFCVKKMC